MIKSEKRKKKKEKKSKSKYNPNKSINNIKEKNPERIPGRRTNSAYAEERVGLCFGGGM